MRGGAAGRAGLRAGRLHGAVPEAGQGWRVGCLLRVLRAIAGRGDAGRAGRQQRRLWLDQVKGQNLVILQVAHTQCAVLSRLMVSIQSKSAQSSENRYRHSAGQTVSQIMIAAAR